MTISRRTLAKGTVWAAPVVMVSAAAPAIAASPQCQRFVSGQPLPAAAFEVTYINITNETLGDLVSNKRVYLDFGFKISADAAACGVTSGSINSGNGGGTSRFRLSNGNTYDVTNGTAVAANGTVGRTDGTCQGGLNGTQACGTTFASPYNVLDSKSTSSSRVTAVSLYRTVTVQGYGTSVIYLNATAFPSSGSARRGSGFSVTSAPLF